MTGGNFYYGSNGVRCPRGQSKYGRSVLRPYVTYHLGHLKVFEAKFVKPLPGKACRLRL